jgi:hypothetical protein
MAFMYHPPVSFDGPTVTVDVTGPARSLARHMNPAARARNVYILTDLSVTETQPDSWDDVLYWEQGGASREVSSREWLLLGAAGYSVTVE